VPVEPTPPAPPRGSATILLAEDDEALRQMMFQVLSRNGYTVVTAQSAEEALALSKTNGDVFDVLVSDVVMAEITGPELAATLQAEFPELRVLMTSGTADASVLSGLTAGTSSFLAKPFRPSQLIDEVHSLIARR
jgi:DNA-binding NtrC family response regulator